MRSESLSYVSVIIIIAFFLFPSCSVGYVSLSALKPAEITLPVGIRNVAIYNNSCKTMPPGTLDRVTQIQLSPNINYETAKVSYLEGIFNTISNSPRFSEVILKDSTCKYDFSTEAENWDLIDSICRNDSADALIVLESNDTSDDLDIYSFFSYCYVIYKITNEHRWSVYYPSEKQFFSFQLTDTLRWEGQDENCYFDTPSLYDLISEACRNSGIKAGLYIAPYWENNIPRVIFTGANLSLHRAARLVNKDSWHEAAKVWNYLSASSNKRLAAKASFNIALAYERDDDLNQSILWINYADSLINNKHINSYKTILLDRARTNELLDSQMLIE